MACSAVSVAEDAVCPAQTSDLYRGWRYRESLQRLSKDRASHCWSVGLREGDGLEAAHMVEPSPGGWLCVRGGDPRMLCLRDGQGGVSSADPSRPAALQRPR